MDLDFTPEQDLLRDSLRRLFAKHSSPAEVRQLENDETGYSPELWKQLGELGVLGLTIPEEYGGSGMTMVEGALVYEEIGRALVASPHFTSCVLAAGLLMRTEDDAMRQQWLPQIASGDVILTVAWLEPDRGFGPDGVQLTATADGDGWVLNGVKRHVPFAKAANALLVLARREDGIAVYAVDPSADGVTLTQELTVASDTQFRVELDNLKLGNEMIVLAPESGDSDRAWAAWHDTMLDGVILTAAQAVGGARAALELTVDYASKREQFDKPLAAFQSLSHYLADAVTTVDGAQTLAWEAAWARSEGRAVSQLAPMAKSYACRTFRDVTATAQQIYGGNGFTVEFDIQLYFRRAKSLQVNWWDDRYLDELIAAELLDAS